MRKAITFKRSYDRSNGVPRKQFKMWKVPEELIEQNGLHDGMVMRGQLSVGDFKERFTTRLTSGHEFSIGKLLSEKISSRPAFRKIGTITFELSREREADEFLMQVSKALKSSQSERLARIKKAPIKPSKRIVRTVIFDRNPDVVAQRLVQAKGRCEQCRKRAPFLRASDDTPYLEVHHRISLADGGDDSIKNTIALCPNCHREAHFGHPKGRQATFTLHDDY